MAQSDTYLAILTSIDSAISTALSSGGVVELTIENRTVKYDFNQLLSLRKHYNSLYNQALIDEGTNVPFNRNGRIARTVR